MSGMKEIREHIESVRSTQKVTNAMYLIASTKMRRAKEDLDKARPFFDTLADEIGSIFRHAGEIDSPYLCADGESDDAPGHLRLSCYHGGPRPCGRLQPEYHSGDAPAA